MNDSQTDEIEKIKKKHTEFSSYINENIDNIL